MNAGFDQVFNLYNPVVFDKGDIIDTYVYRITFLRSPDYGMSTAVGVFKAGVNFLLLIAADRSAKALGQSGIF
jgi:putative aldouronate transport system permease protein